MGDFERSRGRITAMTVVAVTLYAVGSVGACAIAGFAPVGKRMDRLQWPWLLLVAVAVLLGMEAYGRAWAGLARAGDGVELPRGVLRATSRAGFAPVLLRGGSTVDRHALSALGRSGREIRIRVASLDALEHVPMAIGCFVLAVVILLRGNVDPPPLDFVWPWATAPPVGAVLAIWAVARWRTRLADADGWLGRVGSLLQSVNLLWLVATDRRELGRPFLAMSLFWVAELLALWSAFEAFDFRIGVGPLVFAYAVGYVVTRRPAPFGGAGLIDLVLPLCLWDCGVPLATAAAASISYRFLSLWLPLPGTLRSARRVSSFGAPTAEPEPALQQP
ncbi:MAG TPA: lysylphosphatidylglycerol synthase domain-containing protein [Acidimicrobiales bacterium]